MGVLRLALALAVVLYHLNIHELGGLGLMSGRAAVFAFFVISGFYMAMVLKTRYTKQHLGPGFIRVFYASRFLRLYPVYALVLLAFIAASAIVGIALPEGLHPAGGSARAALSAAAGWASNVTLAFINLPSSTQQLIIGPAWSIGVELSFYAIAPFVLRSQWQWQTVLGAVGVSLMFVPYGTHAPVLFGIHFFIMGAVAYRVYETLNATPAALWKTAVMCAAVALLIVLPIPRDVFVGKAVANAQNSADGFVFAALVAVAVPYLQRYTANMALDGWIGRLSYPLYLVHEPVITVTHRLGLTSAGAVLAIALVLSALLLEVEDRVFEPIRLRLRGEAGPQSAPERAGLAAT
jgi:peptidoglycan/LPS O-acetylase OafA/YrhL